MPCTVVVRRHAHSHVSAAKDSPSTLWDSWVVEHARFEVPRGHFPAIDGLAGSTPPTQLPAVVPEARSEIVLASQTIEDAVFAAALENPDSLRKCGALRLPPRINASALAGGKKAQTQTRRRRKQAKRKKKPRTKMGTPPGPALAVHLPPPRPTRPVDAQTQTSLTPPPPLGDDAQYVGFGYYDRLCDRIVRRERLYARARLRAVQASESPPPPTPPPPVPPPPIPPPPLTKHKCPSGPNSLLSFWPQAVLHSDDGRAAPREASSTT